MRDHDITTKNNSNHRCKNNEKYLKKKTIEFKIVKLVLKNNILLVTEFDEPRIFENTAKTEAVFG